MTDLNITKQTKQLPGAANPLDKSSNAYAIPRILIPSQQVQQDEDEKNKQLSSSRSSIRQQPRGQSSEQKNHIPQDVSKGAQRDSSSLALQVKQMEKGKISRIYEKSLASTQSLETTAIFQIDQVLPQQNSQVNRISSVGFVEQNFIFKDDISKQLKTLKNNREKYEDPIFFPDDLALVNNLQRSKYISWTNDFIWKRIRDLYPRYKLLSALSCQTMLRAGIVEIPYLIVALSLLRDYPNRVANLIENQVLHENALYYVRICLDGVWKYIVVDEFIPCFKKPKINKLEPAFLELSSLTLQTHDVWPLVVLKAYAKYLGTYEMLLQGSVEETLRDFTGAPIHQISSQDEQIAQIMTSALDRKFFVLASRYQELEAPFSETLGARGDVAYPISNILVLFGETVLEIRDFLGTWRWRDEELFQHYKEEDLRALQIGQKADAVYMRLSDFQRCFEYISICKCNESFFYQSTPIRHQAGKYGVRKLNLKQSSLCHIELTQKDKRLSRSSTTNYFESRLIVLRKVDQGQFELIDGIWSTGRNISLECELSEGDYYVVVINEYPNGIVTDTVLSYYGENLGQWSTIDFKKEKNVLEIALQQACYDSGERREVGDSVLSYEIIQSKVGLICILFENTSALDNTNVATPVLDPSQFQSFNQPSEQTISLQPLAHQTLVWKIIQQDDNNGLNMDSNHINNENNQIIP